MPTPRSTAIRPSTRARSLGALTVIAVLSAILFVVAPAGSQTEIGESDTVSDGSDTVSDQSGMIGADVVRRDLIPPPEEVELETPAFVGRAALRAAMPNCPSDFTRDFSAEDAVTVSGGVIWQARGDQRIPAAFTEVCLFDQNQTVLGRTVTDADGQFNVLVEKGKTKVVAVAYTSSGDGTAAQKPSVRVERRGAISGLYWIQSSQSVRTTNGDPPYLEVLTSTQTEVNYAFSVYQALVRGFYEFRSVYAAAAPKGATIDPLIAYYPPPTGRDGTKYYPKSKAITVIADDVWDWDVIQHELAHHVGILTGVLPDLGEEVNTSHAIGQNLSQGDLRTLDQGLSLAWVEGWASYAAVSLQQRLVAKYPALSDIPTVGNLVYEDLNYVQSQTPPLSFSLDGSYLVAAALPDNEVVIARFLQGLDQFDPRRPSAGTWPVQDLFRVAGSGAIVDGYDAWKRLNTLTARDACAAANSGFAPRLIRGALDVTAGSQTIEVLPNGPGPDDLNTVITVIFFDKDGTEIDRIDTAVKKGLGPSASVEINITESQWAALLSKRVHSWTLSGKYGPSGSRFQLPGCKREVTNGNFANLSVNSVCEAGTGGLAGKLTNNGDETGQYVISVSGESAANGGGPVTVNNIGQAVVFERVVEPGASATIAVGDLNDGDYLVSVAGVSNNAGQVSAQQQARVKCRELGRDYERRVSCMAANGRLDVTLTNIYSRTAQYRVAVGNKKLGTSIERSLQLDTGSKQRVTVTGLQDSNDYSIFITRAQILDTGVQGDSREIVDETFAVTCDTFMSASTPINHNSWCDPKTKVGYVSVYAKNDDVAGSDFVVTTGGKAGAARGFAAAGGTALMKFEGLRDGKIAFIVKRNGIEIGRFAATIDCS